ncbi:MAG: hypothetical protein ACXWZB_08185 [Gaiellaceae bacterium]
MRKFLLASLGALVVAVPAQAEDGGGKGRALKISGLVVKASGQAVSVENVVGDAVLTCAVPERLAAKTAAFEVGEKVRMLCVRYRGRRAQLVKVERVGEKPKRTEKPAVEKKELAGTVVELGAAALVVQSAENRLACRVPEEKQAKLAGLEVGDKVAIWCIGGVLAGLERPAARPAEKPAGEEVRLYGLISALSRASVTVQGEAGSLTCAVPAGLAEKAVGRFAVGDRVKLMCRGSELTYLERA